MFVFKRFIRPAQFALASSFFFIIARSYLAYAMRLMPYPSLVGEPHTKLGCIQTLILAATQRVRNLSKHRVGIQLHMDVCLSVVAYHTILKVYEGKTWLSLDMSIVVRDLHWPVILNHSQWFEQPSWILGGHPWKIFNCFNFLFSFVSSISAPKMKILPLKLKKKHSFQPPCLPLMNP